MFGLNVEVLALIQGKMMKWAIVLWFICLRPMIAFGDAIGVEMLLLSTHLSDETIGLGEKYPRKLDKYGRLVITPGVEVNYDKNVSGWSYQIRAIRGSVAGYYDSMDRKAGYVHIGPRWEFPLMNIGFINLGFGPTLIFRESWNEISDYKDDGYFTDSSDFLAGFQHKFIPAGDIDLQYQLTPHWQVVWSVVPGIPFVISQSLGVRYVY